MKLADLKEGVTQVRSDLNDGRPFMLSCVVAIGGIKGIAAFEIGARRPRRGKHTMLPDWQTETWLNKLQIV